MVLVWSQFTQPANVGDTVAAQMIGEPKINETETVRFIKYGQYSVVMVENPNSLVKNYVLRLTEKYSTSSVPAGTVALTESDGVTISDLPYSSTIFLNFKDADYRSLLLSGNVVFAAQFHFPGKSITVKMRNLSGVSSYNLSFPASWIFLGSTGRPSSILPSRTGILSITSFGTSDADVIAAWSAQA